METTRDNNSSSADFRIGNATNLGELHQSSQLTEQEHHGSPIKRHLEAQPYEVSDNPITPSSSQNPFLVPPGDDVHHAFEPSPGNPFHEQTNTNDKAAVGVVEPSQNQPSASDNVSVKEQDTADAPPKSGSDSKIAVESSDDDIPVSSMPKHGDAQSGDVAGAQSSVAVANYESVPNKGPEIQNPPVQVMERPGDSGTPSSYTFPSHVFARNNTNAPVEWSTASNESLFSIYMGNTSFSNELPVFSGGKSTELDKSGEMPMPDQPPNVVVAAAAPCQQQPPAAAAPVNKFNDISQRTAEMHVECSKAKATEAKAAETMREVIMETSRTNENAAAAAKGGEDKKSNTHNQTDDMTQSFAFQSEPSKAEDKQKQQKQQSEQKETANAAAVDEASKSTTNPPPKGGWLSCFSCCSK